MFDFLNDSGYLRAFCHLKAERSFIYSDELHSLLCHRCSAIYSGFLLFAIVFTIMRWNGIWTAQKKKTLSFMIAGGMLLITVLQVGYREFIGESWFTHHTLRFCFGVLTGFGLYQFMLLSDEGKNNKKAYAIWILLCISAGLMAMHTYLSYESFIYNSLSTLLGLIVLYILINSYVLISFFPKINKLFLPLLVIILIIAEWSFLFYYNTSHHG